MATVGTDAEGQVTFLVHCIKYSNNGRVDFDSVAKELNIASKAAAAKRFERLLKGYGMKPSDLQKPGGAATLPTTQSPGTPKTKSTGKRSAAAESHTSNTKRAKHAASHPALTSYKDEDDEEEQEEFKVKKETKGDGASATIGSCDEYPRGDDDDVQLLYVVEKTRGCPIHDYAEYRGPHSVSVASDTNTESTQMQPAELTSSRFDFSQLPVCQHGGWGLTPDPPLYAWPGMGCALHDDRDTAQLVGIWRPVGCAATAAQKRALLAS
ncbi:hypothetical protein CSOJ01_01088 [Colletotrichum sojae]|uniref:Myb-like DNA-binding domain-containing protein n=1 Tax=Colletotrichum sojae TaxID=2175907 RepID=A0A8H6JWF1_9PEZI|nr:hypothetical protein CSOJ01_01088 [Colletotrichum sojae]